MHKGLASCNCFSSFKMGLGNYSRLIAIVLCLMGLTYDIDGFELEGYCQQMCKWGRGGNLCKCNAVHFAGKRDGVQDTETDSLLFPQKTEDLQDSIYGRRPELDYDNLQQSLGTESFAEGEPGNVPNAPNAVDVPYPHTASWRSEPSKWRSSSHQRARKMLMLALRKMAGGPSLTQVQKSWDSIFHPRTQENV